jgi:hypothetical protein
VGTDEQSSGLILVNGDDQETTAHALPSFITSGLSLFLNIEHLKLG